MATRGGGHTRDWSALLALVLFAHLFLACPPSFGAASHQTGNSADTDQEIVVLLELDNEPLAEGFLLTERNGKIYIPVCSLAQALSLSISCEGERAFGFVLDQARPLVIDLDGGYTIFGREAFFINGEAFAQKGEILVNAGALSRWLPVDFQLHPESSTLKLTARKTLPLQELKNRRKFIPPKPPPEPKQYPDRTKAPKAVSVPTADLASQLQLSAGRNAATRARMLNSVDLSGDLLYLTGQAHVLLHDEDLKRLDVILSRRSASGYHVGPVWFNQVALGSTQSPYVDGVGASTRPMYGVYLSNRPLLGAGRFLSHDIHGYLPQGWDAELFHNGTQIAYQPPTSEGMYHFVNLRVYYGINSFKVVLHGPFGERRESEEVFVSDATTPTGELLYTLSAGWQTGLTQSQEPGAFRPESNLTLTSDFGIAANLTGSLLAVRHTDRDGEQREYLGVGLRTGFRYTLLSLELIQSLSAQNRAEGQLLTLKSSGRNVFGLNLELVQRFFHDYYSPQFYYKSDPLRTLTTVRGNSSFTLSQQIRVPYSIELGFNTRKSGETETTLQGRVSGGWNGWNATVEADLSRLQSTTYAKGQLQVSTRLSDVSVRGEAGYSFAPSATPSTVNVSADLEAGRGLQFNSALWHDPAKQVAGLCLGVSKRLGRLGYSVSAQGSTDGAYGLDVGVRSSLAADGGTGRCLVSAEPLAPYGMIAVGAAVVEPDGGKRALTGIGFLLNGSRARAVPGSGGMQVIGFLEPDIPVDVTVDMASVEDPFMVALEDGCRITPRAGVVSRCDFTMTTGGEIDGTVMVRLSQGGEVPIKGVKVELFQEGDQEAKPRATTRSEESGYYLFKTVRPGRYRVAIPRDEIERLKASPAKPRQVEMPPGGDMVSGVDFLLESADAVTGKIIGGPAPVLDQD